MSGSEPNGSGRMELRVEERLRRAQPSRRSPQDSVLTSTSSVEPSEQLLQALKYDTVFANRSTKSEPHEKGD